MKGTAVIRSMEDRIEERIKPHKRVYVSFSAYEEDEDDNPIDNLDEVPVKGKIKITEMADDFFGGETSKDWESPVLDSPTCLDLCVQANDMIRRVKDQHHVFLEGIRVVGEKDGVKLCEFSMGS